MPLRTRASFAELPDDIQAWAERTLGGPVLRTEPAAGGYSPGVAEGLVGPDGSAIFVKAGHPSLNPESVDLLRAEARALRAMPSGLPIAGLIDALDQGADGWVALALEHVDGRQLRLPWTDATIGAALASLVELREALTPAPPQPWPDATDELRGMFGCWPQLADVADLDPWLADRHRELGVAAQAVLTEVAGDTLLHLDLRADNLMLRTDGRLIVVDWAWAMRGAAWVDPGLLAMEFISSAEPEVDADAWVARIAANHGIGTDSIVRLLAGILGFFEVAGRRPDPPGLPTVRAFQRFQAAGLRRWFQTSAHTRALWNS